nr:hypothetical protein CFP56_68588 [Quercus suber]
MRGQSLVKVGQTQSNLIDGPETTGLDDIQIQILIIEIEEYGDILMLVKFKTKWMVRLREHSHTGATAAANRQLTPAERNNVLNYEDYLSE